MGELSLLAGEADQFQDFRDDGHDFFVGVIGDFEGEGDVFKDGAVREKLEILEDDADAAAEVGDVLALDVGVIDTADDDATGVRELFASDHFEESGFAGTAGADDDDEFAWFDVKADVVEGWSLVFDVYIALADAFENNHKTILSCGRRGGKMREGVLWYNLTTGRVAELVDAVDLKSAGQKPYGFDSHLAHQD